MEYIKSQISHKDKIRSKARVDKFAEGEEVKGSFKVEREKLESIRKQQVQKLLQAGVPKKYLSEMQSLDLSKVQMV